MRYGAVCRYMHAERLSSLRELCVRPRTHAYYCGDAPGRYHHAPGSLLVGVLTVNCIFRTAARFCYALLLSMGQKSHGTDAVAKSSREIQY